MFYKLTMISLELNIYYVKYDILSHNFAETSEGKTGKCL